MANEVLRLILIGEVYQAIALIKAGEELKIKSLLRAIERGYKEIVELAIEL